jgi:hypothetical protein
MFETFEERDCVIKLLDMFCPLSCENKIDTSLNTVAFENNIKSTSHLALTHPEFVCFLLLRPHHFSFSFRLSWYLVQVHSWR